MTVIDPALSIFALLERNYKLHCLVRHRNTMHQISRAIENAAAANGSTHLFSGFQRLSLFLPQYAHYRALANQVESIYVFGVPDIEPTPIKNVTYVPLSPKDRIAHEWFVISYGRSYTCGLSAEVMPGRHWAEPDALFKGVWTFNPFIVSILGDWLSAIVDAPPLTWHIDDAIHREHVNTMTDMIKRMIEQIPLRDRGPQNEQLLILRRELTEALKAELLTNSDGGQN